VLRNGVHQHGDLEVAAGYGHRLALHRAWKAPAERLHRKLQRQATPLLVDCSATACRAKDECLNKTLFGALGDARKTLEDWQENYTHSALGNLTLMAFLQRRVMDKVAA